MSMVAIAVVPNSAVRPAALAKATAAYGHTPVFVAASSSLNAQEKAEYASFGPVLECGPEDAGRVLGELRRLYPVAAMTFSEAMLPLATELAEGLSLSSFLDRETLTLVTDKRAQRQRLADSGVDVVWSQTVTSRGEVLDLLRSRGGPLVVKPRRSQSSQDTHLVGSVERLPADVEPSDERPFVVEEYLRGREEGEFGDYVSVESLVNGGRPFTLGVTGKLPLLPPFREQAHFIPSHLPAGEREEISQLASAAAEALGIRRGLVHTEIKLTPAGPRIIEVNARIGGFIGDLYERATGQDLLELGIAAACGREVSPRSIPTTGTVRFNAWNQPPPAGGLLRAITGAERVRQEPGVTAYVARMPVGTTFPPAVMTVFMDMLSGHAPDHQGMLATIDRCAAHLRFAFQRPDGTTVTWRPSRHGLIHETSDYGGSP